MLKIRLQRAGRKHNSFFKIVLMENLSKRDGQPVAEIGYYDPILKSLFFNKILLYKALNFGAYPTNTVRHLIHRII